MGLFGFRKKGAETVDFTQGYKVPPPKPSLKYSEGMIDLRSENQDISNNFEESQKSNIGSSSSGFDFLNTMASSSSSNQNLSDTNPITQVSEMSEMNIKLRNITRRLEESSNETYKLLQKIELLEKKIERLERR